MKKHLQLKIRLARVTGGTDNFQLELVDVASRNMVGIIKIESDQIANLFSNRETNANGLILLDEDHGKTLEVKHVMIPYTGYGDEHLLEVYDKAELQYCRGTDWKVDRDRQWNMHRCQKGQYEVTLRRYV